MLRLAWYKLWLIEAEGSAFGALGNGADSPVAGALAGAVSGALAGADPPQPTLQPTSQAPHSDLHFLQQNKASSNSRTGRQRFLHVGSQLGSQAGSQAFTGQQAVSQPLLHSLRHGLRQAFSQAGSQAGSQAFTGQHGAGAQAFTGQQGSGAQAFTGQQAFTGSQQQTALPQRSHDNKSLIPANKSRTGVIRQHFFAQPVSQAGSQALTGQQGSGAQAFTGSQALAQALHSPQPPQFFSPIMRSSSSSPNDWEQRATLSKSAPKIVLLFIEQQLLYNELILESVHTVYGARTVEPLLGSRHISDPVA